MSRKSKTHAPRVPLSISGGIRSQIGRGRHVRHWWGMRWMSLLEQVMPGPRLGRGRSYAASGQVAELTATAGCISAQVQGASPSPYAIEIQLRTLDRAGKRRVLAELRERPLLAARLLVHELPPELEKVFQHAGCPLFPERRQDLKAVCNCPDWAEWCKHAAAVSLLLAEVIDRNPLLLLALRGIDRQDLTRSGHVAEPIALSAEPRAKAVPLAAAPAEFWGTGGARPEPDLGPAPVGADAAPLLRRLGPILFWRGEERFADAMRAVYTRAAGRGWAVWSGEALSVPSRAVVRPSFRLRHRRLNMDVLMR